MASDNYGEEDYIAMLAFAGPPPHDIFGPHGSVHMHEHKLDSLSRRVSYIEVCETFCQHWFEGKPIDGQWANFYTNFQKWFYKEKDNAKTIYLAANHPLRDCGSL